MICPNCQRENKNTNIRCETCGTELINVNEHLNSNQNVAISINTTALTTEQKIKNVKTTGCIINIILLLITGPFLLVGLLFTAVGTFSIVDEQKQIENYVKTEATLVEYINCDTSDGSETCEGLYEYEVNGIKYTASPNKSGTKNTFSENETVYYNPNKPSESLISANWSSLLIIGLIITVAILSTLVDVTIWSKKTTKKLENGTTIKQFSKQNTMQ